MNDRLYRSRDDRILAGVAGGVADNFGIDPSLVRILWVILTPLTGGLVILLYVVMAFIVPLEPGGNDRWAAWNQNGWGQAPGSADLTGPTGAGSTGPNAAGAPGDASAGGASAAAGASAATPMSAAGPTATATPLPVPGAVDPGAAPIGGFAASAGGAQRPPVTPAASWPSNDPHGQRQAAREARHAARNARRAELRRDGTGALIVGLVLVLIGGFFLARAYVPNLAVDRIWPILLVGIGVVLVIGSIRRPTPPRAKP